MSRDWFAVYTNIFLKPKYRRLSLEARAALFHVWALAGQQRPEATWQSREDLHDQLELDGWETAARAGVGGAYDVVDELIQRRWLDVDDDGRLLIHDWDDHQLAATNAARREYEPDRKREWRRPKPGGEPPDDLSRGRNPAEPPLTDPLPTAPPSPDITRSTQLHDNTTQASPNVPDVSRTNGAAPYPHLLVLEEEGAPTDPFNAKAYDARVAAAQQARFARQGRS